MSRNTWSMLTKSLVRSVLSGFAALVAADPTEPYRGLQGAQVVEDDFTMSYRYYLPEEVAPGERLPLVLYLHSAGRQGTDNRKHVDWRVTRYAKESWQAQHPAFFLAPQVPEGRWADTHWGDGNYDLQSVPITRAMQTAIDLVESFIETYPIDPDRVYVLGTSMGAFGTWDIIMRRPDLFAAAVPVEGGGDPGEAPNLMHLPIWAWHGDADKTVPVESSRDMIAAIRGAASDAGLGTDHIKYTELPGIKHRSAPFAFTETTDDWFLSQRRGTIGGPNEPPTITDITANMAADGQVATLGVIADDPDGDDLRYVWSLTSGPTDAAPTITQGPEATITFDHAGDYVFEVKVMDPRNATDRAAAPVTVPQQASGIRIQP